MQLESFCLAILLGREGGYVQRARESGSAIALLPDVFLRTLLPLPVYVLGHTKATKRDRVRQWKSENNQQNCLWENRPELLCKMVNLGEKG